MRRFGVGLVLCLAWLPPAWGLSIDSFSPVFGAPGTSVTILGSGFLTAKEVFFNNTAGIFTVLSDGRITVTVPLDATSGTIGISADAGFASSTSFFLVAPRISDFEPRQAAPGAMVLLTGANFDNALSVFFKETPARNFVVLASTQLQVEVPVGATSGPIRVITPAGSGSSDQVFQVSGSEPIVIGFAPRSGLAGTAVTLNGNNFLGATAVLFNGVSAEFFVVAANQLQTVVPKGAATGPIAVASSAGKGISSTLFIVSANPIIDHFAPTQGLPGTEVVIDGKNFSGASAVQFNGTNAAQFAVVAPTQIRATVPPFASSGPIRVVTPVGSVVSSDRFVVSAAPLVEDFSPKSGAPGVQVIVTGRNFFGTTRVRFGGTNAPAFSVTSDTQLIATVPSLAASGPISVETPFGTGLSADVFQVRSAAPVIDSFQPRSGRPGTIVTLQGADFDGALEVRFNGVKAIFSVTAPTQIQAIVPDQARDGPISVMNRFGTGISSNRFLLAPQLSGFAPTNGFAGAVVTITGANLTDLQAVRFGGVNAVFTNLSANQLSAVVPLAAKSGSISVLSDAGIVATTNFFFVQPQISRVSPLGGPEGTVVTIEGSGLDEAQTVRFNGTAAAFRMRAPTELQAIVPSGASTGLITVTTPVGDAVSPQVFWVGPNADLKLSLTALTNAIAGVSFSVSLQLTNQGPSAASDTIVTATLDAGLRVITNQASHGTWKKTGAGVWRWRLGTLAAGAGASAQLQLEAISAGRQRLQVAAASAIFDAMMADNSITLYLAVDPGPRTLLIRKSRANQLTLAWPKSSSGLGLESSDTLRGPWTAVPGDRLLIGDQIIVTTTTTNGSRFYRLKGALP